MVTYYVTWKERAPIVIPAGPVIVGVKQVKQQTAPLSMRFALVDKRDGRILWEATKSGGVTNEELRHAWCCVTLDGTSVATAGGLMQVVFEKSISRLVRALLADEAFLQRLETQ